MSDTYRLGIVGSRRYPRLDAVDALLNRLYDWRQATGREIVIVSGTEPASMVSRRAPARDGVDESAIRYARGIGLATEVYGVTAKEWKEHGKAAGPMRNTQLVNAVDALAAFWDLQSRGTADAVSKAIARRIRVEVYGPDGQRLAADAIWPALAKVLRSRRLSEACMFDEE